MKFAPYILLLGAALSACQNDDSNLDDLLAAAKEKPIEIEIMETIYPESPDKVPDAADPAYNDYIESLDPKAVIAIEFVDGDAVMDKTSSRVSFAKNGAHVEATIFAPVKFVLSGDCSDGSIKINGDNRFVISLNGLRLVNPAGAVINNQCKKTLYMETCDGTENLLVSAGTPAGEADSKGCVFSEGQIAFSGSGLLRAETAFRSAIASDDYIFVRPCCRLSLKSTAGHGIKANDGVKINGGTIDVQVDYDGAKGISSDAYVAINGGRTTIINSGTTRLDQVPVSEEFKEGIDTVSSAGVKCAGNFELTGGELRVKCLGNDSKGIKSDTDYLQTGGSAEIVTLGEKVLGAPKGIKTDGSILVTGGYLYAYSKRSKPLDADGLISVYSYQKQTSYLAIIGQ